MWKNVTLTAAKLCVGIDLNSGGQEWVCIASIALTVDLNFHFLNECSFFLWSNKTWEVTELQTTGDFWCHGIRLGLSLLGLEWYLVAIPVGMWWDCTPKLTVLYTGRTGEVHTFYTSQLRRFRDSRVVLSNLWLPVSCWPRSKLCSFLCSHSVIAASGAVAGTCCRSPLCKGPPPSSPDRPLTAQRTAWNELCFSQTWLWPSIFSWSWLTPI